MAALFSQILNMSMTGSIVILLVILVRLLLKRSPKIFSYVLWSVVLFRLLCPVSVSGPGSLLQLLNPQVQEAAEAVSVVSYLPVPEALPEFQYVPTELSEVYEGPVQKELSAMDVLSRIWLAGAGVMSIYASVQYILLRKRLVGAARCRRNIYLADHIDTAFVMGILRPKIYLPSRVPEAERKFILAHERHHIRRGDHIVKLLAYLALCVHWFNPLVWVAFILAGKDMEMSCDEAVIKKLGAEIRGAYSAALLQLAIHRKPVPGMPLAFGEGDTKGRIMNMAKWKKPKVWVSVLCLMICIAILAACAVNPVQVDPVSDAEADVESTDPENTLAAFSDEHTNILITCFSGDEATGMPNATFLLSVHPQLQTVTIGSVLGDAYVSLPNYQGHVAGNNKFQACYALGKAWGDTEGAEEMVNQCMADNFGISIDYNVELTGDDFDSFPDALNTILGVQTEPLSQSLQNLTDLLISYIAGKNDVASTKQLLTEATCETCTIPYEGTYMSKEVDIGGSRTPVLVIGDPDSNQEKTPIVEGVDIVLDAELIEYGNLKLLLPEGYGSYAQNGGVILTLDGADVGGIRCYQAPDMPFDYSIEYLRAMGLPEAQETEEPIAYMIGNNIAGGIEAEFFHELKPETLNVEHNCYPHGDLIYDVYFDQNVLNDVQASKFLKTIQLNGTPIEPPKPEEGDSMQLCRNVLSSIQSGAYQIAVNRDNQGEHALNRYSTTVYGAAGDDWVSITHVPDDDSYHGYLYVGGNHYSNEGSGWDAAGNVNWEADPYPDAVYVPWLAGFAWDPDRITYTGTITEDGTKTVMLRIDEPFPGYEDLTTCYFVNVRFTEDGSFLNAEITLAYVWEYDVSYVKITESVVTLEESEVTAHIKNEHNRALAAAG